MILCGIESRSEARAIAPLVLMQLRRRKDTEVFRPDEITERDVSALTGTS
jgi:hypothetical protein